MRISSATAHPQLTGQQRTYGIQMTLFFGQRIGEGAANAETSPG
ncbi:hypothetical protein [Pseudomonas sp. FME51]|nr:hypothetical protein [Pseudomonas sp. FME51]